MLPATVSDADYEANIEWTPVDRAYTLLNPEARGIVRNMADVLAAQMTLLEGFSDEDAYLETPIDEFRMPPGRIRSAMGDRSRPQEGRQSTRHVTRCPGRTATTLAWSQTVTADVT